MIFEAICIKIIILGLRGKMHLDKNKSEVRGILLEMPKRRHQDNPGMVVPKESIGVCIPIEGQRNLERLLLLNERSRLGNLIYDLERKMISQDGNLKIKPWIRFLKMLKNSEGISKEVLYVAHKIEVPWNLDRVRGCDSKSLCEFWRIYNSWNKHEALKSNKDLCKTDAKTYRDFLSTLKDKVRRSLGLKRQLLVSLKEHRENN